MSGQVHLCVWGRPFHRLRFWRFLCLTCRGEMPTTYADYYATGRLNRRPPCPICWPPDFSGHCESECCLDPASKDRSGAER